MKKQQNLSPARSRNANNQSNVKNYENKFLFQALEHFMSNFQDTLGDIEITQE